MVSDTTSKSPNSASRRKRGRPVGYRKHSSDAKLLLQAARLLNSGSVSSPRQAFIRLTDHDESAMRRLHRQWRRDGDRLLRLDRAPFVIRCEHEFRALRREHPKLWSRISTFLSSPAGRRHLNLHKLCDGSLPHPMALGLDNLLRAIEIAETNTSESRVQAEPDARSSARPPDADHRPQPAPRRFDQALQAWLTGGFELTPETLRDLARLANTLADQLEADQMKGNKQ